MELQLSNVPTEINEFGWFETNATGTILGARHVLFQGSGSQPPTPVGQTVTFKPTLYFGYYFSDVSENGCLVYTLSRFNDPSCFSPNFEHNFAVFNTDPGSPKRSFWIAGLDPAGCGDDDCNLTLVKVVK